MPEAPLQSPTEVDEVAKLAMKEQPMMEDLQILCKRKDSLLFVLGNLKEVYLTVNTPSGEASSSCQPNMLSNMDVKISATPLICSTTNLPSNKGDRSSKRIKLYPTNTVISFEHGTRAAL